VVFANALEPSAGPGLIFQDLAAGRSGNNAEWAACLATLFFVLLGCLLLDLKAISLLEPVVEWAEENTNMTPHW